MLKNLASSRMCLLAVPLFALMALGTQRHVVAELPAEAVEIIAMDEKQLAAFVEERRGKVIFVDFWATWCAACIEEFPHTVELHRKYAERGLVVASMSLDDLEEKEQAQEFLNEQQAGFANWISAYGGGDESFTQFEIANGALPHYKLYDRTGRLVKTFNSGDPVDKPFTAEEVEVSVRELLDAQVDEDSQ